MLASIALVVGLYTRIATIIVWLYFSIPMLYCRVDYYHHTSNFALVTFLMIWLPLGDHFSFDRALSKSTPPPERASAYVRLPQLLLALIYSSTFYGKANAGWFDGTIMRVLHEIGFTKGPFADTILELTGVTLLSWYTLFAQAFFPVAVWFRGTRKWAIFFVASLHIGIDFMMSVTTFSYQMCAMYVVFLNPKARQIVVTYCPKNNASQWIVRGFWLLDWFARFRFEANESVQGIETSDSNGISKGLLAIHHLAVHTPLLFLAAQPLSPVVWFATRNRTTLGSTRPH